MKVFFVIRSTFQFYYNKSVIEALIKRGHAPLVFFEKSKEKWTGGDYVKPIQNFQKKYPNFTYDWSLRRSDKWEFVLRYSRAIFTYRRYLFVQNQSDYFKERNIKYLPTPLRFLLWLPIINPLTKKIIKSKIAGSFLSYLENIAGIDQKILKQVKDYNPDVVLITIGGMRYGSMDLDYVKIAKALHIPCAISVLSWDSLSAKAFVQIKPDVLLAWNEIHLEQAIEHHGIRQEMVKIIGSPMFDDWFSGLKPSLTREEFCARSDLNPSNIILLYLGSPSTIAMDERWLVKEIRKTLDSCLDKRLKNAQIVFRPHPAHNKIYENMENEISGVWVFPKHGSLPDMPDSLQLFYDTLYYSLCSIGVNTSAMIESIIADRAVIVPVRKVYDQTQKEAQHFKALLMGEVLELTKTPGEFINMLAALLAGKDTHREKRSAFVKRFIRPRGFDMTAGEAAVVELENLVQK